jgi:tetratricopeptide (TPR) repeat protein
MLARYRLAIFLAGGLLGVAGVPGCEGESPDASIPSHPPPAAGPAPAARSPLETDSRWTVVQRMLGGGSFAEAEVVLATWSAERADDARLRFLLGLAIQKQRRYQQARELIESSLAPGVDFPERRHADHFLGWCLYYLGEPDAAAASFRRHLELVPDEPDSTFALGLIALDAGELDEAEAHLSKAIELQSGPEANPRDLAKALARLGDVREQSDLHAEAEELYMRSLAKYPNSVEVWEKLARVRDRLGKEREAASARHEAERARARRGEAP